MKFLKNLLEKPRHHFEKGGKFEKLYPLYEAMDTFLYTPADFTRAASHIRDSLDQKRLMITVVLAILPAAVMGIYNTGYQANLVYQDMNLADVSGWRISALLGMGLPLNAASGWSNFVLGLLFFLPIYLATMIVGGLWETIFALVRKHEINEGFLVTGMLVPLIVPPTIPLWQIAIGISFGVVIGKEIFGGSGMNVFNPALLTRAFLFFNFPASMSGNAVWVGVDGFTAATPLAVMAESGLAHLDISLMDAFLGFIPGSIGETSTLAILIGALMLLATGIASWEIMLSIVLSAGAVFTLFNWAGSATNSMFAIPFFWHFVVGGFAFGTVFMATDPVSAAMTRKGKVYYGVLIGLMVALVRVINPAFPEGMMLAILFGNAFAPIIDVMVLKSHIKRRKKRYGI